MRDIVFMGTPAIACPFLQEINKRGFRVKAVITQPDRLAGRGMNLICPAVKNEAQSLSIPVFQPNTSSDLNKILLDIKPDVAAVVAYGRLLKKETLDLLPLGFINAHFSLLPKYRGAAPVRRAILNGETETGITIFKIDEGMDEGPIILSKKLEIGPDENSISLFYRLSQLGKVALAEAIDLVLSNKAVYSPQQGQPSRAPKIEVGDTYIDFSKQVNSIYNAIRAFSFDPRARFKSSVLNSDIQIISARPVFSDFSNYEFGAISGFEKGKGIFIKCQGGAIFLEKIKPQGKKEVNAFDFFINGKRMKEGDKI